MFHKDLKGLDLHFARTMSGSGSPVGVVTPFIADMLYYDTLNEEAWISTGVANTDWELFAGGGGGGGGGSTDSPGEHFLGSAKMYYPNTGTAVASRIQYARVPIQAGVTLVSGRVYVVSGGSPTRLARVGLYDQAVPTSPTGVPNNRIAQTATFNTSTTGLNTVAFAASYLVPTTGFYWVAFVCDNAAIRWTASDVFPANYIPVYRETGVGLTLPATAGGLTNPQSAVVYAAGVE